MRRIIKFIKKIFGYSYLDELKSHGLTVGENFSMQDQCIIDISHCWLINIGDNVTLAPRVYILAHDASTKRELGYAKIGRVTIGNNVFIGANSLILPNVTIGDNVIIGAGSVVTKDIPKNSVAIGNPAKVRYYYDEYINKMQKGLSEKPKYDSTYTLRGNITLSKKEQMKDELVDTIGFVE